DAVQPLAQVRAIPFASMDTDREVMLVWFREGHPAAPVATTGGEAKAGNANIQPQAAPPRPKPAATSAQAVQSPGEAGVPPTAKPAPPKPAKVIAPEPKEEVEEGPPIEEDISPKPEPKTAQPESGTPLPEPPTIPPPTAPTPQASASPGP